MTDGARSVAPPVPPLGPWQQVTVVDIRDETAAARTFRLALTDRFDHLPGQHVVVRLTAPDGYTASRSYSISSAPDGSGEIELTVEHIPEGEVSSFLHDEVVVGDQLEVRGPIGRWFVWQGDSPAVLIGGGSGVAPLMAMLRHARRIGRTDLVELIVSVRTPDDLYFRTELEGPEVILVHTREAPPGSARPAGHLAAGDLPTVGHDADVFVCGSNGFADAATMLVMEQGVPAGRIRVERFGATG